MKKRQDAWTKDEDMILAETVLRFVRSGKTQMEAFNEVGKQLSRTPAACGFRWNATVRKQYEEAFKLAKQHGKNGIEKQDDYLIENKNPIETAITLLESIKKSEQNYHYEKEIKDLTEENQRLKQQLLRYEEVMTEMKNLWEWLENETEINVKANNE